MFPAEISFFPLLKTCTCSHSLNVTGSSDFFSSTVMPMLAATERRLTLFTSLTALLSKKPRKMEARHRIGVRQLPRVAAVGDVDAVGARRRELRHNCQRLASGRYGFTCS